MWPKKRYQYITDVCELFNSFTSGRWGSNFRSAVSESVLWIKLMGTCVWGECPEHIWYVNIGSGNGLVLMLFQIYAAIWCHKS